VLQGSWSSAKFSNQLGSRGPALCSQVGGKSRPASPAGYNGGPAGLQRGWGSWRTRAQRIHSSSSSQCTSTTMSPESAMKTSTPPNAMHQHHMRASPWCGIPAACARRRLPGSLLCSAKMSQGASVTKNHNPNTANKHRSKSSIRLDHSRRIVRGRVGCKSSMGGTTEVHSSRRPARGQGTGVTWVFMGETKSLRRFLGPWCTPWRVARV
jgi:hypothetical protein